MILLMNLECKDLIEEMIPITLMDLEHKLYINYKMKWLHKTMLFNLRNIKLGDKKLHLIVNNFYWIKVTSKSIMNKVHFLYLF